MEEDWVEFVLHYVEDIPFVLIRLSSDEWNELKETKGGIHEFSLTRRHADLKPVKRKQICLAYAAPTGMEHTYIGLVSSVGATATLDSRIKVRFGQAILPGNESELVNLITDSQLGTILRNRLSESGSILMLSSKVSRHLLERLIRSQSNKEPIHRLARILMAPRRYASNAALQEDALQMAFKVLEVDVESDAVAIELNDSHDTALGRIHIREDSVIEHDARAMPGWTLNFSDITGRAIFKHGNEYLEVITANRRPLEECFGVDLIYLNAGQKNIVMVQYKMLDQEKGEWLYRPDAQLVDELTRMQKFSKLDDNSASEFRLSSGAFYLKLVKRDGALKEGGIIMPLNHFEMQLNDKKSIGPRGGVRISYDALNGSYLRRQPFVDLIRAGYIGSRGGTTAAFKAVIDQILIGDRSVVAAIQRKSKT